MNQELHFDIDPNPNGRPILCVAIRYSDKKHGASFFLSKEQTEQLIKELQYRLPELE